MENRMFGKAEGYLIGNVELGEKEALEILSAENIVKAKMRITISSGKDYLFDIYDFSKLKWETINNKKLTPELEGAQRS